MTVVVKLGGICPKSNTVMHKHTIVGGAIKSLMVGEAPPVINLCSTMMLALRLSAG